jgi:hypothetical protein
VSANAVVAGIQPAPLFTSQVSPTLVLCLFGSLTAVAFLYGLRLAFRTRDIMPVVVCLGALVGALNEPIYDLLGKIVYADNATTAFTAFNRDVPLFLVIGYVPWVGGLPYVIARMMAAGVSRARLHLIALGSFVSVTAVESIGTGLGAWKYYGEPPLKILGVAPMMAPVPIVAGLLLYALGAHVHGRHRAWLFAVPCVALPAVYASCGFPMYVALHADVGKPVQYLAGAATLALCAATVGCATRAARLVSVGSAAWQPSTTSTAASSNDSASTDARPTARSQAPST